MTFRSNSYKSTGFNETHMRKEFPDQTQFLSDDELLEDIKRYQEEAKNLGIETVAAEGDWVRLNIVTGERIKSNKSLMDQISNWPKALIDARLTLASPYLISGFENAKKAAMTAGEN